jgi:shikimate dehydrogenase
MSTIDVNTQLCAVIGNPIEHSLSPCMHNAAYRALELNYAYLAFQVENVAGCLAGMRALPNFRGMSVTIPHKRSVMEHLDEIDPMAEHIGSVNTITHEDGKLIGSSTDGPGTLRAFEEAGATFDNKHVLFTGTGGAVRAVAFAVAELTGASGITILGRTPANVEALAADLSNKTQANVAGGDLKDDMKTVMATHDVIMQGTPVGMHPNPGQTCIPANLLSPEQTVFDMVYRPHKTQLLQDAEAIGCRTIVGIEMLINQAVLQFERWTGGTGSAAHMRAAALAALAEN